MRGDRLKKRPWYIWFSILAGLILIIDSSWRILFSSKEQYEQKYMKSVLVINSNGQMLLFTIRIMIPLILLTILYELLGENNIELRLLVSFMQIPVAYFSGVYATYKFSEWRQKHLAHLLNSK